MHFDRLAVALIVLAGTAPAVAQYNPKYEQQVQGHRFSPADRAAARDWSAYHKYDYDRPDPAQGVYYADRYYRDFRYYQSRALDRDDRLYRGENQGYYCRRPDGTTGRVSILGSGVLGAILPKGGSERLETLAAADGNAKLAQAIDRKRVICQ